MVKATQPLTRRLTQPVDAALSAFTNLEKANIPAQALALMARMATPPTDAEKARIVNVMRPLVNSGAFDSLDFFHRLNAADAQAASLNWIANAYNLTAVDAPVFTAGKGYQGDGVNDALSIGFTPSTAGGKLALNDATMGVLILGPDGSGIKVEMGAKGGTGNSFIGCNGGSPLVGINADTTLTSLSLAPPARGLWTLVRRAGGVVDEYLGRFKVNTRSAAATSLPSGAMYYLSSTAANFSSRAVALGFAGKALTDAQVAAVADAVHRDMIATGAYDKRIFICSDGNSLVAGANSQVPYTTALQTLYDAGTIPVGQRNTGVVGQTTTQMIGLLTGTKMLAASQYPADHRILVVWELHNDVAVGGVSVTQAIDNLQTYCNLQRSTYGYEKIIVINTIADGFTGTTFTPSVQAAVNAELLARYQNFADYHLDLASDSRFQNPNNTTYYDADKRHLLTSSYAIVASLLKPITDQAIAALGVS